MEDFLIVIVLILYLFAAASGKKKKTQKKQRRQQRRQARRGDSPEAAFEQAFAQAAPQRAAEMQRDAAHDMGEDCGRQRIHLHEVSQRQMEDAGEGEDPCHAGDSFAQEPMRDGPADDPLHAEETQQTLAQDVLRGVIMSEILTRPCDRMAMKRNRRSAV